MSDMTLVLSEDEAKFIHAVLNDLPTKTGAYPLVMKIQQQIAEQITVSEKQEN